MPEFSSDPLGDASGLLLEGKNAEARALLAAYLKTNPTSDQAWFVMSHAVTDPLQQQDCLTRALDLNPSNKPARDRLALLRAASAPPPPPDLPYRRAPEPPPAPTLPIIPANLNWPPPEPVAPPPVMDSVQHLRGELIPPGTVRADPDELEPPTRPRDWTVYLLGGVGALVVVAVLTVAGLYFFQPKPTPAPEVVVIEGTPITFPTLPPTWTATAIPSITPQPSPVPTRTPRPSATFAPPETAQAGQMDKIAEQVADLRGLAIESSPERFLISRDRVEDVLKGLILDPDRRAGLENELRVLSVLGLVKPTYDLVNYALNSSSDSLGGFYIPWTKQMFVIGDEFTGLERFVYSHEFDHALTDQHFDIAGMGVYPNCQLDAQHCAAIRALVEGDATVLMYQWLNQYATPQDYKDFANYNPPDFTLPEEFPPPYVSQDINFPYTYGADFVQYLYNRGRWASVNKAYVTLPASTEQILHPEKYLAGEAPKVVTDTALSEALPAEWHMIEDNVLGEWMTFLILGYGADFAAELPDDTAWAAANGWGGDHYQVYYQPDVDQTALAAHWVWDTPRDGPQFAAALRDYLDARLRGAKVPRTDGDCWEANDQAGCVFTANGETLWLYAPNQTLINAMLALYPQFSK